jgi:hypothetical protein
MPFQKIQVKNGLMPVLSESKLEVEMVVILP